MDAGELGKSRIYSVMRTVTIKKRQAEGRGMRQKIQFVKRGEKFEVCVCG
jgi:hypothetical protein